LLAVAIKLKIIIAPKKLLKKHKVGRPRKNLPGLMRETYEKYDTDSE